MKELANRLGMNEKEWELVGLLHDLDYDIIEGDARRHGFVASKMLEGKLPPECLHAIRAHDHRTGVEPKSVIDKALIVADCIWGLIARAALAVPSRKIGQIAVNDLKQKLEDRGFPTFLANGIMMCEDVGLTFEEFFKLALKSLPPNWIITKDDL